MSANLPYNEKVIEHFTNPRNMGEIENADGVGNVGSPACGDVMSLYIKVDNGIITDAKFKTFGCGAAIASSSMTTEMVKGKTLANALKMTNELVVNELGGLPGPKVHCSVMAEDALKAAISDYYEKHPELEKPAELQEDQSTHCDDCTRGKKAH